MPGMNEIYFHHADRYHQLVEAEDYQNNLSALLHGIIDWTGAMVIEAGTGTGRTTALYADSIRHAVCYDQSEHMLNYAARYLESYSKKITFERALNSSLPRLKTPIDIFIEGWSFGHSVTGCKSANEIRSVTRELIENASQNLRSGGHVIIIETLGTNSTQGMAPHPNLDYFYQTLETIHSFKRHTVSTDYQFPSNGEAAEIMGFFFGEAMRQGVIQRGTNIIPERTGVWVREV